MCNDLTFIVGKSEEATLLSRTGLTSNCKQIMNGKLVIPQYLVHKRKHYKITKMNHDCLSQSPLDNIIILAEIVEIGAGSFSMCKHLNHIDLTRTNITKIPEKCFYGCSSLSSILLPKGITQLGSYSLAETAVESFEFDEKINLLGNYCFMSNIHLSKADLSSLNITSLHSGLFKDCIGLTTIVLPQTIRSIESYALSGTSIEGIDLFDSITSLGDGVFSNCSQLTSINLKKLNMETLPPYLFFGCEKLTKVELPNQISIFSSHLFEKTSLFSIDFPSSLKIISSFSFEGCKQIEDIELQNTSLEEVHEGAFENCTSLKNVFLPLTLKRLDGCLKGSGIQTIDFAQSELTEIASMMFYQCSELKYVGFPPKMKKLNDMAFARSSITAVDLSNSSLEYIGKSCFEGSALSSIKLPLSISNISEKAFAGTKLNSFIGLNNLSFIGQRCFCACQNLRIVDLRATSIRVIYPLTFMLDTLLSEFRAPFIEEICERAFAKCGLKELRFGKELKSLHPFFASQMHDLELIDLSLSNITELNSSLFDECEKLEQLIMPKYLKRLNNAALMNCGIKNLTMGSYLCEVNERALSHCRNLRSVDLMQTKISFISESLFEGDLNLKCILFPTTTNKIGRMAFKDCGLVNVNVPETITFIAIGAFMGNSKLKFINMSQCRLKTFNKNLFADCIKLKQIIFPLILNTLKMGVFNNSGIKELRLPSTITTVNNCFGNCPYLTSLDLSLTQISIITKELLEHCTKLSEIILPINLTIIAEESFKNTAIKTINIPPRCALDKNAFSGSPIQSIDLSEQHIAILPPGIFRDCFYLTEVKLPSTLESIQSECFANTGFVNLTIENVKTIADGAISCSNLLVLNLSNTKLEVLESLEGCYLLEEIYLPQTLRTLSANCLMRTNIHHVELPASVETVESGTFLDCVNLKSIDISNTNIRVIEGDVFFNCISLQEINWNSKVTTLSEHSFSNTGFSVFIVPPSVEKILTFCFFKCSTLKEVNFSVCKVSQFSDSLFQGCKSLEKIYFANKTYKWGRSVFAQTGLKHIVMPVSSSELRLVFDGCKSLRAADLSKSKIILLHERVFGGCSSLRVIVLPPELEMVSMIAFQGCYKIESVYYFGNTCFSNLRLFQCHPKIYVSSKYNCKYFEQQFPEVTTNFTIDIYQF